MGFPTLHPEQGTHTFLVLSAHSVLSTYQFTFEQNQFILYEKKIVILANNFNKKLSPIVLFINFYLIVKKIFLNIFYFLKFFKFVKKF